MSVTRRIARPLLAGYFIYRGVQLLRNPEQGLASAQRLNQTVSNVSGDNPALDVEPATLVKATGITQVACGAIIALSKHPRPAALTLAAVTVPYAISDFPFWEQEDPQLRDEQLTGLLADLSMVGGLLLAAVDTDGKPSLAWRTKRAAHDTRKATGSTLHHAKRDARLAKQAAKANAAAMASTVAKGSNNAVHKVGSAVSDGWSSAAKKSPFGSGNTASTVGSVSDSVSDALKNAAAQAQEAGAKASAKASEAARRAADLANEQSKKAPWAKKSAFAKACDKARDLMPV